MSMRQLAPIPRDYERPAPSGLARFQERDRTAADLLLAAVAKAEGPRPILVREDPSDTPWVQIVGPDGYFAGFDPTEAQIEEALVPTNGTDAAENALFLSEVAAKTRQVHDEMAALAQEDITGVVSTGLWPYRPRDAVMKKASSLFAFGGVNKDEYGELNTTENNRGEA